MAKEFQKFVISQVGVLIRDAKCLILEDAAHAGRWILPGGRIDEGEESEPAFRRELKEEIDLDIFNNLGLVSYDIWYVKNDMKAVCALAFLIENNDSEIKLSSEHSGYQWIREDQIKDINFVWPKADKMVLAGFERYKLLKK